MKQGIDISKWQTVDWNKVDADFVIIRAGYGYSTIDPKFEQFYAEATKRGIPCGAYWYAYWGSGTPKQEAQAFLAATSGKTFQYGLWYDVEYEKSITRLTNQERTDKVLEALDTLQASGRYVGLYASTDMVNNRLEYNRLSDYDLWIAQYSPVNTCKRSYGMWQYSSAGSVSGVAGRVDCDTDYKDYPTVITSTLATGKAAEPVKTEPEPTPPRVTKTLCIGPASRGDLKQLIDAAEKLDLYTVGSLNIGPMTEGDTATIEALAKQLNLSVSEV